METGKGRMKKSDCTTSSRRNQNRQAITAARAKLAYDAYTVAAGEPSPVPFIALWPRQREGWIAAVQSLDDPLTEPKPYREEAEI
jgi:hypothetical protein